MRILFSAGLSTPPQVPGSVLHRLHYLRGLRDLGHDVYFVEETYRDGCVDDDGTACPFERSANVRAFARTMEAIGFEERASLVYEGGRETFGLSFDALTAVARDADLLINMSGHLSDGPVFAGPRCRLYLDSDPVYTQIWHAAYGVDLGFGLHDAFATRGCNVGTPASPIPDCSVDWIHTLPPVVLPGEWTEPPAGGAYTTVASWDVFGDVELDGEWYGSRRSELVRFATLPERAGVRFEMRVKAYEQQDDATIELLRAGGWQLAPSSGVWDVAGYLAYVTASRGEIGIAKNAYVKGRSGWFSERSAEYLAAGRPVIAQSTGYESVLPTGVGLLSFATVEEAAAAVRAVEADPVKHARRAREIAESCLSHRVVLPALLDAAEARS
jgi:hypothetical protein